MRCTACNTILNDVELTRVGADSGQYLDMCNTCCAEAGLGFSDRLDLLHEADSAIIEGVTQNRESSYEQNWSVDIDD